MTNPEERFQRIEAMIEQFAQQADIRLEQRIAALLEVTTSQSQSIAENAHQIEANSRLIEANSRLIEANARQLQLTGNLVRDMVDGINRLTNTAEIHMEK